MRFFVILITVLFMGINTLQANPLLLRAIAARGVVKVVKNSVRKGGIKRRFQKYKSFIRNKNWMFMYPAEYLFQKKMNENQKEGY